MVASIIIVLIFIIWVIYNIFFAENIVAQDIKNDRNKRHEEEMARKRAELLETAEQRKLREKLDKKKELEESIVRQKKQQEYIKQQLTKYRKNPDMNIAIYNDESYKIHWERLKKFSRSMYSGEMYYRGSRGGIYTISANGTRNYKY